MKKMLVCWVILIMIMFQTVSLAAEKFLVGVAPHTSARVILSMYQPLRQHLEQMLGYPVDIVTAPDFNEFARRGLAGDYDLAVTTAHLARLFQMDAGYIPFLTYKADFKSVVVVAANGAIRKPADLKNAIVVGLGPSSQVTLWGVQWLQDKKVAVKSIRYVSASDSEAQLVLSGDASAAFMSLTNFQNLMPRVRNQLRMMAQSKSMPGRIYVLNARHASNQKKIEAALWSFAETSEAKKYFENNRLEGYRTLKPKELTPMDAYAAKVRSILQGREK
ncbi:MAG TPA: phosphate/phosphite/phosphonate ABC transporter substrate-binding protein [Smithellaceae bacterium]|jgi:phosphonate transport system substrate-binding protein|nr:phosphate/phosphite/phosphonate ABC transporter substrate-binding protein [Smithellaceae bacterium]